MPLPVIAAALTIFTANISRAQVPVDANPAPPPAPTAPAAEPVNPNPAPAAEPAQPTAVAPAPIAGAPAMVVAPSSINELNIAARDSRTLNPMLNPTDGEIRDALQYGRDFGATKQDFIDLLEPVGRPFDYRKGGMLGELRRASSVAYWITPDEESRWRGFLESRSFADQNQRDADFTTMQQEVTSPTRSLVFVVEIGGLISSHDDPTQAQLDATYTSVAGTRFVLSDDHGNNYNPVSVATQTHLVRRQDFYDGLAPGPDRLGQSAFADPAPISRSLVLRRKPYSDFAAFYIVTFDALNPDGSARVNRDVHGLTLRIVTPEEPKYAYFDVDKMP